MRFREYGNRNGSVLFFIHGWPDSGDLWAAQVEAFKQDYFCVVVDLPNSIQFETKRGYDFPELTEQLVTGLRSALGQSGKSTATLIGHDWGANLAYRIEAKHPELVDRMITMDVGGHFRPEGFGHSAFIISYQWWLVLAYFIGKRIPAVGDGMSRLICRYFKAPRVADVHSYMNFYYFYIWRSILLKSYADKALHRYRPTRPILYLYGKRKPYMFHSKKWLEILAENPSSRVVEIARGGHWFMRDQPEQTLSEMRAWL